MNRSGDASLVTAIEQFAIDRIYFFSNSELFFPGEKIDTSLILNPGQMLYALPAGTLQVLNVRILIGSVWLNMVRVEYRYILQLDISQPAISNIPNMYALFGGKIRFWPRPQVDFRCELTVEAGPLPPKVQSDSNFWTNEAFTLIVESTCEEISRLFLNDEARANRHQQAAERELRMLRTQTNRILGPIVPRPWF